MVLRNLRVALFPKNSVGPPAPPPPSAEERAEIQRKAASSILALVPGFVTQKFYSTRDEDEILGAIENDILCPFGDQYLNKHLVYGILELILVRVMPELGEQSISALLAERGVVWTDTASLEDVA